MHMHDPDFNDEVVAQNVSSAVETVLALRQVAGDVAYKESFDRSYDTIAKAINAFDNDFASIDVMAAMERDAGNNFYADPGTGVIGARAAIDLRLDALDEAYVRHMAYATSLVACAIKNVYNDARHAVTDKETEAYNQFLVIVEAFWTYVQSVVQTDVAVSTIMYWTYKRDLRRPPTDPERRLMDPYDDVTVDTLGMLLRLSLVADVVAELVHGTQT